MITLTSIPSSHSVELFHELPVQSVTLHWAVFPSWSGLGVSVGLQLESSVFLWSFENHGSIGLRGRELRKFGAKCRWHLVPLCIQVNYRQSIDKLKYSSVTSTSDCSSQNQCPATESRKWYPLHPARCGDLQSCFAVFWISGSQRFDFHWWCHMSC